MRLRGGTPGDGILDRLFRNGITWSMDVLRLKDETYLRLSGIRPADAATNVHCLLAATDTAPGGSLGFELEPILSRFLAPVSFVASFDVEIASMHTIRFQLTNQNLGNRNTSLSQLGRSRKSKSLMDLEEPAVVPQLSSSTALMELQRLSTPSTVSLWMDAL